MKKKRRTAPSPRAAAAFAAFVTFATYVRTLSFDFTYDDHHHFVDNAFVHDLSNLSRFLPWRYFESAIPDQGRPVLVLSELLDVALGASAATCHLQSVVWHTLNVVLVFVLARNLRFSTLSATAVAVLFGLHPVNVEAVAGIANREDLLATCFGLLALLAARRGRVVAAAAAYALSLGSKESALAIPVLFAILAVCSERFRPDQRARRWLAVGAAIVTMAWAGFQLRLGYPSLVPGAGGTGLERAALSPMVSVVAGFRSAAPEPKPPTAPARRPYGEVTLPMAVPIEGYRAGQLLLGWPTAPEYDLGFFRGLAAFLTALGALAALVAAAVRDLRGSRRITLGVAWFLAATIPVSVPTLLLNPVADRYLYLPSIGAALLLGWFVSERLAGTWPLFALGLVWFGLANVNLAVWTNDVTLFSAATRSAPRSARAHQNLGSALLRDGQLDAAERALSRAVELDPELLAARFNLGILEEQRGNRTAAVARYRAATTIEPIVAEGPLWQRACARLAVLLRAQGRTTEVQALMDEARRRGLSCH
ncbi:MAG: tetratricopeptide repeat protein [Myxococcales bacterium]|nr:tetratricopeptide repeat protein [Myxococcales bacterium]